MHVYMHVGVHTYMYPGFIVQEELQSTHTIFLNKLWQVLKQDTYIAVVFKVAVFSC